jgi:hypothetical protein
MGEVFLCSVTLTPLRSHFSFPFLANLLNASTTIRNKNGDNKEHCLIPRDAQNNIDGAPLMSTIKEVD